MKLRTSLITILTVICTAYAGADTIETRFPLKKLLAGKAMFEVAGGKEISFRQIGDKTTVALEDKIIASVEAPQFVRSVTQSDNGRFTILLIGKDRTDAAGNNGSDYHSVLRITLKKKGEFVGTERLLPKTHKAMKDLNRWIVKIDSVLNDGRTVRLNWGEQIDEDDPAMEMRYSWQVRDLDTGKLYRDENLEARANKAA